MIDGTPSHSFSAGAINPINLQGATDRNRNAQLK